METKNEAPASMPIHPGSILKDELKERGISQKQFAKTIDILPSHLSEILRGKYSISSKIAIKLENALGIPSIDWVNLQAQYDYDVRQKSKPTTTPHLSPSTSSHLVVSHP